MHEVQSHLGALLPIFHYLLSLTGILSIVGHDVCEEIGSKTKNGMSKSYIVDDKQSRTHTAKERSTQFCLNRIKIHPHRSAPYCLSIKLAEDVQILILCTP